MKKLGLILVMVVAMVVMAGCSSGTKIVMKDTGCMVKEGFFVTREVQFFNNSCDITNFKAVVVFIDSKGNKIEEAREWKEWKKGQSVTVLTPVSASTIVAMVMDGKCDQGVVAKAWEIIYY